MEQATDFLLRVGWRGQLVVNEVPLCKAITRNLTLCDTPLLKNVSHVDNNCLPLVLFGQQSFEYLDRALVLIAREYTLGTNDINPALVEIFNRALCRSLSIKNQHGVQTFDLGNRRSKPGLSTTGRTIEQDHLRLS